MNVPDNLDGPASWTYTIDVTANNGAPEADTMTGTVNNSEDTVEFGPFEYTAPGTYTYTVAETGTIAGVTNDAEAAGKTVTVTVVDNNDGTLTATADSTTDEPLTFTNDYSIKEPVEAKFEVKKTIEGKDLEANEFSFELKDSESIVLQTKKNAANGTVSFDAIEYKQADAGKTFTYNITEVDGKKGGYTYDTKTVTVTVKVTDNGDGTLSTEVKYSPENPTFVNDFKLISIDVEKVWKDSDDNDGIRPSEVVVELYADGKATGKKVTLSEKTEWKGTFENIPEYDSKTGKLITYDVKEAVPTGYTAVVTGDSKSGFVVTNTHEKEKVKIKVTKIWVDENNKYGLRPESVKFTVTGSDESSYDVTLKGSGNTWTAEIEVIKYNDGVEITYEVDEEDITAGYKKDIDNDTLTITNTFKPWWGDPPVKKEITGDEPAKAETFTFMLTAVSFEPDDDSAKDLTGNMPMPDGADGQKMTMDVKAGETKEFGKFDLVVTGVYTYTITEVKGDAEGYSYSDETHTIVYTVTKDEDGSLNCVKTVDGNEIEPEKETDEENVSKFTFTNVYTMPKVSVKISKVWEDNNNEDLTRPEGIKVKLFADGKDTGKTIELSKDTEWAGTFEDLDKYDADGKEIKYTVDEAEIPEGYSEVVSGDMTKGYVITNSLVPPTGDTSDIFLWSGISIASLLGLGYLFIKRKKEEQ